LNLKRTFICSASPRDTNTEGNARYAVGQRRTKDRERKLETERAHIVREGRVAEQKSPTSVIN